VKVQEKWQITGKKSIPRGSEILHICYKLKSFARVSGEEGPDFQKIL